MAFADIAQEQNAVALLQRSLERDRLGHAYLFTGTELDPLETAARTLAKTLNCEAPRGQSAGGQPLDCCDACLNCRKIDQNNHPDVQWVRPESKSRIITIGQMRRLMQTVNLKPTQSAWKVFMIVGADRLNTQAANAFLKTLEEPPADSILILISTDPERLLETIHSRCLRLNFSGESRLLKDAAFREWLTGFSELAANPSKSLLGRYRLLSHILNRLNLLKEQISERLKEQSPLEQYEDLEPKLKERWQDELAAAIEAEYRRTRTELMAGMQWWFRDVWLKTIDLEGQLPVFPELTDSIQAVSARLTSREALGNLQQLEHTQRLLTTNVQEALALEVSFLKLNL